MKRTDIAQSKMMTTEGVHTARVISIGKADEIALPNTAIITLKLPTKFEKVFLKTKAKEVGQVDMFSNAIFDIATQLNNEDDFDTEDVELMNTLFSGQDIEVWAVYNVSQKDGKTYCNIYFNKDNNKVSAMLAMA